MVNSAKRAWRRKLAQEAQRREGSRSAHQMDPADLSRPVTDEDEEEDREVLVVPRSERGEESPPVPTTVQASSDCEIMNKVNTLNGAIASVSQDMARIRRAYDQLRADNITRDKALADLSAMVKEYGSPPELTRPHPVIRTDVLDEDGNLRGADIGITWAGNETFLHGVRVVGPGPPRPLWIGPAMSTPYQPTKDHDMENMSTLAQPPTPSTPLTVPDADIQLRRPQQEICQVYRPAAPIQRFNNKSLIGHGWSKDQRALQLVSYLDETAMNVAQELGDSYLYNYDVLVKLLSARFDPASRVLASRSRFHGRFRHHHEDADAFADALTELCRVGYPQSPPELRQELIAEQFVRGQSDPELKKYLWVVIRTQKERKLQTLIEVCTDFSSLTAHTHTHQPAEKNFAVHRSMEASFIEEDCESEAMFAVGDRPPWTGRRASEPPSSPTLHHMFALARRMGYDMRPIARRMDNSRQSQGNRPFSNQDRGFRSQTHTGRDYSKVKCFSCGQFGHMQSRCPRPDASLPCKPAGWYLQSEGRQQRDGDTAPGNSS